MKKINAIPLLLASRSESRKKLLQESCIETLIIEQHADESSIAYEGDVQKYILQLVDLKMSHAEIPSSYSFDTAYVLTADTIGMDENKNIYGKPRDREQARNFIQALQKGTVVTGFCIEKRIRKNALWKTIERKHKIVTATYELSLLDSWIDFYLDHTPYANISGALMLDGVGAQFVKTVHGSYTAILGLPICEVRETLEQIGFYSN